MPKWFGTTAVVVGVTILVLNVSRTPDRLVLDVTPVSVEELEPVVEVFDGQLETRWHSLDIPVANEADELTIARRISLALHGTVPSLEEIRALQADDHPDRLLRWTRHLLSDRRYADYFSERLARAFVGADEGQFLIFRRDRFTDWLADQLHANRPYDDIVREVISREGLWTGEPATNFITSAFANDEVDENKLTARTVRAFLGQRIDCAQCHDHPFDDWTQAQFEGLAAFYGQTGLSLFGVEDKTVREGQPVEYILEDRETLEERVVEPAVPFHPEWVPDEGRRRERLAAWVTHPENRRFARATVNRVWALLFGQPMDNARPVDDLTDPPSRSDAELLDLLADHFQQTGFDLKQLILTMTATKPFRLSSEHPAQTMQELRIAEAQHAVFPVTRLRPEQVIGSIVQAASVRTVDRNSNLIARVVRLIRERDFIDDFGDLGNDEFAERSGTVAQSLLRMNGKLVSELLDANLINASGRLARFADSDEQFLRLCFLVCLTREPTQDELTFLLTEIEQDPRRTKVAEDVFWALFNTPEFSWNH